MSIMGPPKIGKAQRSVLIDLKIESLRLRKLLKSLGKLKALHDDGRDKMSGEYILDYHYVENLAEQAMETAGAIAFDAGVIAGDGGNELFDLLDTQRERAQNLRQAQDDTPSPSSRIDLESEAPPAREPEYQMLDRTLDWIGGGRDDTRETLEWIRAPCSGSRPGHAPRITSQGLTRRDRRSRDPGDSQHHPGGRRGREPGAPGRNRGRPEPVPSMDARGDHRGGGLRRHGS